MKLLCVAFTILLLLSLPFLASAEGTIKVLDKDGKDITSKNIEVAGDEKTPGETLDANTTTKEDGGGYLGSGVKAAQTAFENALNGFVYGIIDQLMAGSVTIFEAEADNRTSGTVTYRINTKLLNPFDPPYVVKTLLVTGSIYLCIVFFVILGSYLMLLAQAYAPEQFSDFRAALTGEEKPYSINIMTTASFLAVCDPLISFLIIFLITGLRNLLVFSISPHEVVLPDMVSNSIPTALLTGLSSYSSAFQSASGEYGVYVIASLVFVRGAISDIFAMFGALKSAVVLNVVVWGLYLLCNVVDIVNTLAVSFGVGTYIYTGNPIFLTIGIIAGCSVGILLFLIIVIYAISRGKRAAGV